METNLTDIKKQYKQLKAILGTGNDLQLSFEDALRYRDALKLLKERGYILDTSTLSTTSYLKIAEWEGFEDWLNEMIKESKRLSRREWIIGIVCAVVGAIVGLIPYIITLFDKVG